MSIAQRQIQIACEIIKGYDGELPFHLYLGNYFKNHKNFGSRDRRNYRNYCYTYWRIADAIQSQEPEYWLNAIVNEELPLSITKLSKVEALLSTEISYNYYLKLFEKQAEINTIVIRKDAVNKHIEQSGIVCKIEQHNYTFAPNTNLDWLVQEGLGWIMDKGSAQVMKEISDIRSQDVWDACSGAGGKSLWLSAFNRPKTLLCTDIRANILENLRQRFSALHFALPELKVMDTGKHSLPQNSEFGTIICDVPCTGSGTWRRTPENYTFFKPASVDEFAELQFRILQNTSKHLLQGGSIYYMTCSVFEKENEGVIKRFLKENSTFQLVKSIYTTGDALDRDVLYCAKLVRG